MRLGVLVLGKIPRETANMGQNSCVTIVRFSSDSGSDFGVAFWHTRGVGDKKRGGQLNKECKFMLVVWSKIAILAFQS